MSVGKAFVDSAIKQYKVVGFSKSYCPYCKKGSIEKWVPITGNNRKKAKEALDTFKFKEGSFGWIEIEDRKDMDEIQDYLKDLTGARSVPRVFIGGKFFGGGDDTKAAHSNGSLEKKLNEVGAI